MSCVYKITFWRRNSKKYRYYTAEMLKLTNSRDELWLVFTSQMAVTEQFWQYGFMSYIAESGGFVGLFLGWSLLQMEEVIVFCLNHRYLKYLYLDRM